MTPYPVTYHVERPARFTRLQLLLRLIAFALLGLLGLSMGVVYVVAYVGLAAYAAARLSAGRDPDAYLADDGPRILRFLRWTAAITAWFGFVSDRLPEKAPSEIVTIDLRPMGRPTTGSALWRLLLGLPSLLVLAVLCFVGGLVWLWAAITVLVHSAWVGSRSSYLAGLQRYAMRLLAYQASLVDVYPPFTMEEDAFVARPLAS